MARNISRIDVEIGANLRRLRTTWGMSLEELGRRLGITYQQVQKYESGANRIAASRLPLVCAALNCRATDIVTDEMVADALLDSRTKRGLSAPERPAAS